MATVAAAWTALVLASSVALAVPTSRAADQTAGADRSARAARLVDLCRSRLDAGEARSAADAAREAAAIDAGNGEAQLCLGIALTTLGEHAAAVAPLEHLLEERPDDPDGLFALATTYAALEDPRAQGLFERLVALRPGDTGVRLALAEYLWDHGQNRRGNDEVERILATAPSADVRVTYAIDLLRQWQFARAARQLEQAQAEGERTYRVAYLLGNAQWEAGDIDAASESLAAAIAIDPSAAPAQHELGRLLLWMGRPSEAVAHLEKAAASAPQSAAVALDLGRSYERADRLPDAERSYRHALALEPALSPIYYALGRLLKRMGRDSDAAEALATYQRLYEREQQQHFYETSHRAELDAAQEDLRRGDAAAALDKYEKLGNVPDALIGRANALSRLNRHAEAIEALERVRLLAPNDQRVTYFLARERAAKGPGGPPK
jgi:tetratricopeptide (TPR) repeat protein